MKIKFNMGIRMLLFKLKYLDENRIINRTRFEDNESYKQFLFDMVQACNEEVDFILKRVGHAPTEWSYKRFRIKKL